MKSADEATRSSQDKKAERETGHMDWLRRGKMYDSDKAIGVVVVVGRSLGSD